MSTEKKFFIRVPQAALLEYKGILALAYAKIPIF